MRDSNILIVGFQGLAAEVCKNLVLAGVNSVTILETENTTYADLGAHIFLTAEDVGKNVSIGDRIGDL
jgi:molybdopterin/thiamine biosynthesis adenylyltransferase